MEKTQNECPTDHLDEDFEVIELGSVRDETEGTQSGGMELGPNSKADA